MADGLDFDNFLQQENIEIKQEIKKDTQTEKSVEIKTSDVKNDIKKQEINQKTVDKPKEIKFEMPEEFEMLQKYEEDLVKKTKEKEEKKLENSVKLEELNKTIEENKKPKEKPIEEVKQTLINTGDKQQKLQQNNNEKINNKQEDTTAKEEEQNAIQTKLKEDEFIIDKKFIDVTTIKDKVIEGTVKNILEIDFKKEVSCEEFEKQNEEFLTIYYMLNDNTNNPEFLDDDVLAISKKEEELRNLKLKREEEFNFQFEELVEHDKIMIDLSDIQV